MLGDVMTYLWQRLPHIPADFWSVLGEMAPYLLFGFVMAGILSVLISARTVERHLGGRGIWPVVKAAVLGVPLPLCSCSVIPVAASLRKHGASRGATTSFLVSTPQTGADSIFVTWSLLGGVFAVFRPVAALVSGLVAGAVVALTERPANPQPQAGHEVQPGRDACHAGTSGRLRRALTYSFVALPAEIGTSLLVGLVIAALIAVLLPPGLLAQWIGGGGGIVAILVMMAAGLPIYVCATASVPVAAALVMTQGISPGAAFAFLVTGPASNAATIVTIWRVLGPRTAVIYLLTIAATAVGGGLVLDQITSTAMVAHAHEHAQAMPPFLRSLLAAALLALLLAPAARSVLARLRRRKPAAPQQTRTLNVTGMTCSHCARSVERALLACHGVSAAHVDLRSATASVTGTHLDTDAMRQALEQAGYGLGGP